MVYYWGMQVELNCSFEELSNATEKMIQNGFMRRPKGLDQRYFEEEILPDGRIITAEQKYSAYLKNYRDPKNLQAVTDWLEGKINDEELKERIEV